MTVRSKLLSLYGLLVVTLVAAAALYLHTLLGWRLAAEALSGIYAQDVRAEHLSAGIHNQINRGLDFLGGSLQLSVDLDQLKAPVRGRLTELMKNATTQTEREHIEGLEETEAELEWRLAGILRAHKTLGESMDRADARIRLREIADEVNDDVAALNQYYQSQVDERMRAAADAGSEARVVTFVISILVICQVILLVVLIQRWMVRPMAALGRATDRISRGDLATRVALSPHDDWRQLAESINEMARSLEISRQKERIQERFSTLGEVAAYAAHNIKNPLASIRMTAQSSLKRFRAEGEAIAEPLEDIISAADRLDAWVRRFLDFARPLDLQQELTDLNALITRAVSVMRSRAECASITVESELTPENEPVYIDPVLVEQAVALLLSNAVESGGNRVRVASDFYRDEGGRNWAAITIDDNGEGLPEGASDDMFKLFVTRKKDGTGLGLSQTRKIVHSHGGSVDFESKPGPGARIVLRIPAGQPAENS